MSKLSVSGIVDKLRELCQCSLCFNIPKGQIFNCPTGHSVCQPCYWRLPNCQLCEKPYQKKGGGCRNFDKENLCKYYSEVLKSVRGKDLRNVHVHQPPSTSNGHSKNPAGELLHCPYKEDGCSERDLDFTRPGGPLNGSKINALIEHTRECEFRPIECVIRTPEYWKGNTFLEKKRFCGPSDKEQEMEDRYPKSTPTGWIRFEPRSKTKEVPWKNYIEHLQADHGASFCFQVDPEDSFRFWKTDGVFGETLNNAVWPPHLFKQGEHIFLRQQWIWNNEIQNRIFLFDEPCKATGYIATIKVSKVVADTKKETLKCINVLPIRMFGHELLKLGWDNPRHDYSTMEVPFAEKNYFVKGQGVENDPTFAWNTWIEIGTKYNVNPMPFSFCIPADSERFMIRPNYF